MQSPACTVTSPRPSNWVRNQPRITKIRWKVVSWMCRLAPPPGSNFLIARPIVPPTRPAFAWARPRSRYSRNGRRPLRVHSVPSSRDRTIFGFSLDMTSPVVDRDRPRATIVASAGAPGKRFAREDEDEDRHVARPSEACGADRTLRHGVPPGGGAGGVADQADP